MNADVLLERSQWDFFWLPSDCTVVDRPELMYAVSPRDWMTANVITRIRSDRPGPLLDEVLAAHAGRATRVLVCPQNRSPALVQALEERGFVVGGEFLGFSLAVDGLELPRAVPRVEVRPVTDREDLHAWLDVAAIAFGSWPERGPHEDEFDLKQLQGQDARVHRFVAWRGEQPVGAAGMTSHPALSFGFLWAGGVVPEARGLGVYTTLLAARLRRAKARGLARVGLYGKLDTSAPILRAKGFEVAGPMTYYEREPRDGD